nr:immunogenic protein [Hymenolepis microstoma]
MSVSAKSSKKKATPQGPSVQEIALQTFQAMDLDKSGKVSFSEFQKNMEKKVGSSMSSTALRSFFDSFDANKDGELSLEELTKLVETTPM